jgi:circadian clock protein KaiB
VVAAEAGGSARSEGADAERARYRLFVAGETPRATRAVTALRSMFDTLLPGAHELEVIDVLVHPELAEDARILATPTVVRLAPQPERRVVGDLSDTDRLMAALELAAPHPTGSRT